MQKLPLDAEFRLNVIVNLQSQTNLNIISHFNLTKNMHIWTWMFSIEGFLLFYQFKEKSWSVLLLKAYISNGQVRAERCENCKSTTEILTANYSNPNLLLYGCKDNKCKHRFLKIDFDGEVSKTMVLQRIIQTEHPKTLNPYERLAPTISS